MYHMDPVVFSGSIGHHNSFRSKVATTNTTTSVTDWYMNHHSCVYLFMRTGDNLFLLVAGGEQSTSSPRVTMICLPSIAVLTTCSDMNRNSSFLLLSKRKNSYQFRRTIADGRTLPSGASASLLPCAGFQTVRDVFIPHQIQPLYIFN